MAFNPMENAQYPNLVNWAKGLDPNGNVAAVAEILMKSNPIIEDIPLISHDDAVKEYSIEVVW